MVRAARVLIVEEEILVALDIQRTLESAGAGEVILARNAGEAFVMEDRWLDFDLAIVEAKLGAAASVSLVAELGKYGVPSVVTSADSAVAAAFPASCFLEKPFDETALRAACREALKDRLPPAS